MLSQDEKNYLEKIPVNKTVSIKPFSIDQRKTAENIISKIRIKLPKLEILLVGASGLEISGQGDLDIYALANPIKFKDYLPTLIHILGNPKSNKPGSIAWELERNGYPVEFYLTDPESKSTQRQISVFKTLENNPELLSEYENLKSEMSNQSFREYQKKKYEFYHKILGD